MAMKEWEDLSVRLSAVSGGRRERRPLHAGGGRRHACAARRRARGSCAQTRLVAAADRGGPLPLLPARRRREGADPRPRRAARARRPLDPRQHGGRVQGLQHTRSSRCSRGSGRPTSTPSIRSADSVDTPRRLELSALTARALRRAIAPATHLISIQEDQHDEALDGRAWRWRCGASAAAWRRGEDKAKPVRVKVDAKDVKVNINEATKTELMHLAGVGAGARAEDHRLPGGARSVQEGPGPGEGGRHRQGRAREELGADHREVKIAFPVVRAHVR